MPVNRLCYFLFESAHRRLGSFVVAVRYERRAFAEWTRKKRNSSQSSFVFSPSSKQRFLSAPSTPPREASTKKIEDPRKNWKRIFFREPPVNKARKIWHSLISILTRVASKEEIEFSISSKSQFRFRGKKIFGAPRSNLAGDRSIRRAISPKKGLS